MITIRREAPTDRDAVHRVLSEAFGGEDEGRLVDALRDLNLVLLSLVAEEDAEIVGHVLFSPMTIENPEGSHVAVCLSPLAVLPSAQRKGIGGALIEAGLAHLRAAGHVAVFLLGHPEYYPRFGFQPARNFDVHYRDDPDAFMALELRPEALDAVSGRVRLAPPFEAFE